MYTKGVRSKALLALILSTLLIRTAYAERFPEGTTSSSRGSSPSEWNLCATSGIGLALGIAREFVYSGAYVVSELVWPMEPLVFWESGLRLERPSWGLRLELRLRAGLDGRTGTMSDSDFLNMDGVKTHFSAHECFTERAMLADIELSREARLGTALTVGGGLGLTLMRFKWTARDGYLQYPTERQTHYTPWTAGLPKEPHYGTGIVYEQNYLIPSLVLRAGWACTRNARLSLTVALSPLAACDDLDNHVVRGLDFVERMRGGLSLLGTLRYEHVLREGTQLWISGDLRLVGRLVGDTIVTHLTTGEQSTYGNGGGAGLGLGACALGLSLSL